jgi:aspartyl-tRNA(Asn)/glutamyl-tRNA(Gln) amidotransferase subunit A
LGVSRLHHAKLTYSALGTDTGGSVRLPASYCGVVGFKPSYGLISRHGVVAYADSLDCVGILAQTTADVRAVFGVVSQPDEQDMTCVTAADRQAAAAAAAATTDRPLRVGIPVQTHLEAPHLQLHPALLEHLQSHGATLHAVDMPSFSMALPAYYVLACAEAASNLGRFGGSWYGSTWEQDAEPTDSEAESGTARRRRIRTAGFGPEVRKRILAGTHALTADAFNNAYLKALQLRRAVRRDFAAVLRTPHPLTSAPAAAPEAGVDVLLFPTAVRTAPVLGQAASAASGAQEYLQDLLTVPASLAGLPAISVPAGRGADGWPAGVSLVGQWGCDDVVFRAAEAVEAWRQ